MIYYERSEWYGLTYLLRIHGSLIPRLLPCVLLAGVLSYLTVEDKIDAILGACPPRLEPRSLRQPSIDQRSDACGAVRGRHLPT